jgi:hypothetical protein
LEEVFESLNKFTKKWEYSRLLAIVSAFTDDACQISPFPCNGKFINIPSTDTEAAWWSGPFDRDAFGGGAGAWAVRVGFLPALLEWSVELSDSIANELYVWPVRGYK